jgi:hypothetical protein
MKKFIFVCLVAFGIVFSSCAYHQQTTGTPMKTDQNGEKWLNVECFQTLTNLEEFSACLALDDNWNVYYIIHITPLTGTKTEVYYDSKRLDGKYVFVGTYSYENKSGDAKTVQAYMPKENFYWWYNYDKEALKQLLDNVLSYDSVR